MPISPMRSPPGVGPRSRRSPPFTCTSLTSTPRRSPTPSRSTGRILAWNPSIATGHATPRRRRTIPPTSINGRSRRSDGTRRTARPRSRASRPSRSSTRVCSRATFRRVPAGRPSARIRAPTRTVTARGSLRSPARRPATVRASRESASMASTSCRSRCSTRQAPARTRTSSPDSCGRPITARTSR